MNKNHSCFATRTMVVAVHGALLAMAAMPVAYAEEEPAVAELTQHAKTIEVGVRNVSSGSFKAGEYNGLEKSGASAIVNIDLRGGGSYDSEDATRWRVTGDELGLETRNLSGEYGQQGKFRVNFGYDELLRNRSDTYQTPYQGAGSSNLTLPANWLAPKVPQTNAAQNASGINFRSFDPVVGTANGMAAGVAIVPTNATLNTLAAIRAADLPAFHNVDLYTKRDKYNGGFSYNIDQQLELAGSIIHEKKTGYKPMGTVSSQVSEFSAVIPDLIDSTTDQYNFSIGYTGDKGFLRGAYYGSIYKNNVTSMTWQDVNDLTKSATMSSAPSNEFHQLSLTGGYNFTKTTKLVMDASYARNTQNDAYLGSTTAANGQLAFGLPASSLDGLVVTKAFDAKLTAKPIKDLSLAANYKYDNRDNRTPVNIYLFQDANEAKSGTSIFNAALGLSGVGTNTNIYANRAYSKKVNQLNLDADYAVAKGHVVKVGYDLQKIDRTCDGSWIDCADANTTKENTLRAEWRARPIEDVSAKIGYAYSQRKVDNYNENAFLALVPMAGVAGTGAGGVSAQAAMAALGFTGFGALSAQPTVAQIAAMSVAQKFYFGANGNAILAQALYGSRNNINELPGMRRYNMADRNRDKVRTSVNWQANEQLSFQGGLDFNQDDYDNSVYGLKNAKSWALNLDATYAASENFSASVFYTYEDQRSQSAGSTYGSSSTTANLSGATVVSGGCYATVAGKNNDGKMDPCLNWSTDMSDKVDTLGIALKQKGLMAGKLEMAEDVTFTRAHTDIGVNGGNYVANPLLLATNPATATAYYYIPAAAMPTVTSNTVELKVRGKYNIDKKSAVNLMYAYLHMTSNDYIYTGMQIGTGTNYMPTMEQAPSYTVHVVGASYIYNF